MASEHVIERTGSDFMINVIHTLNIDSVAANTGASFRSLHESLVSYGGQRNYKTKNFILISKTIHGGMFSQQSAGRAPRCRHKFRPNGFILLYGTSVHNLLTRPIAGCTSCLGIRELTEFH